MTAQDISPTGETAPTLAELEKVIEDGLATFLAVGTALVRIRDERLYQEAGYDTFDRYCRERWDMSGSHAYRLMDASEVVRELPPTALQPANEAQARELKVVEPEARAAVMQEASEATGGKPTAHAVRVAAARRGRDKPTWASYAGTVFDRQAELRRLNAETKAGLSATEAPTGKQLDELPVGLRLAVEATAAEIAKGTLPEGFGDRVWSAAWMACDGKRPTLTKYDEVKGELAKEIEEAGTRAAALALEVPAPTAEQLAALDGSGHDWPAIYRTCWVHHASTGQRAAGYDPSAASIENVIKRLQLGHFTAVTTGELTAAPGPAPEPEVSEEMLAELITSARPAAIPARRPQQADAERPAESEWACLCGAPAAEDPGTCCPGHNYIVELLEEIEAALSLPAPPPPLHLLPGWQSGAWESIVAALDEYVKRATCG